MLEAMIARTTGPSLDPPDLWRLEPSQQVGDSLSGALGLGGGFRIGGVGAVAVALGLVAGAFCALQFRS
jgi:hypothetical protein